jgi:two-component system, OmpR family, sensor histidine kinase KdpD
LSEDGRPDPDALLDRVRAEQSAGARGRLKVFFGASPGVGKTYAMLGDARRKQSEGLDVLVGWVETHGRQETSVLAEGLPRLPPRESEYRGALLKEFDLDEALRRRPALLLLDELAHTNAPGSRHPKRWQDVEELLDTGVDVWTTLNVQHLESLNDLVARITDVAVRETVPDRLLERADEVEFIDLSPEELLERLQDGKVYLPEQAQRAARSFFRRGNLAALRELALRRTADHVDADVRDYRHHHEIKQTWPVAERLLVCIRPNPESGRLIRAAHRLAARLRADWTAAFVESTSQPALSGAERESLAGAFKLAEELGGNTVVLSGEVGRALLDYSRQHNVSGVVVGKPTRSGWRARLRGTPIDAIVGSSGEIDVYVVSSEREAVAPRPLPAPPPRVPWSSFVWAALVVLGCTLVAWTMLRRFDKSNLIMVYLLGVAFVATRFGRWPSVVAATLSVAAFDFFFVAPHLTFAVSDTQYLVTFAVMLVVALLISTLAVRVRDQGERARQRERRTRLLYTASRELAGLRVPGEIAAAAARQVADVLHGPVQVLLPDAENRLHPVPEATPSFPTDPRERAVADWAFTHARRAGLGTDTLPGSAALYLPLPSPEGALGVLGVVAHADLLPLSPDHLDLLEALARLVAAPLHAGSLSERAERARLEVERERLRGTLLSSVSHDLRTPLAAITGAASTLQGEVSLGAEPRRELTQTIYEEAERLNRLVGNLLDMTRLEAATVDLKREWHSLEEVIGTALARVEPRLQGRRVQTLVPEDLPLVPIDGLLVQQLLVNLLENAARYTPDDSTVCVSATARPGELEVAVADDGPGLPPGQEERVFEKFFRRANDHDGFGLGLAIAKAVVDAHGGRIRAENRLPHGVAVRFTLPIVGTPPAGREAEDDVEPA